MSWESNPGSEGAWADAFASKPAPTGKCSPNVGAGLLANAADAVMHRSIWRNRCGMSWELSPGSEGA